MNLLKQGALLSARGLAAGYGGEPVIGDVNLSIGASEIVALVGPNGCGKSTLLKALARVLKPMRGEVVLNGSAITSYSSREVAQMLAFLPQGPIAPEGLSVRELVAQGRFPHQTLLRQWSEDDQDAVEDALTVTDTAELADRPVATLSGGQRQRCWIAMTLAQDTSLLLLDEPTTFLDLKVQMDVMGLLGRIARQRGRTLLMVLHEINLAAAFADQILMMREGEIIARGTPSEVVTSTLLGDVFDLTAEVISDPQTGRPVCLPRPADNAP